MDQAKDVDAKKCRSCLQMNQTHQFIEVYVLYGPYKMSMQYGQ